MVTQDNFLIFTSVTGVTKCGTTDMFAILQEHPMVSSRAGKETQYFDRLRRGRSNKMNRSPKRG